GIEALARSHAEWMMKDLRQERRASSSASSSALSSFGRKREVLGRLVGVHQESSHSPELLENSASGRVLEVRHAGRAARADLLPDKALHGACVVVAPKDEVLLELDQVLAQLVRSRELLRPRIHGEHDLEAVLRELLP